MTSNNTIKKKDTLVTNFDWNRSLITADYTKEFTTKPPEFNINLFGFIVFFLIFVLFIPHILLKHKQYILSAIYFCNLDIVATIVGFSGGPFDMWKYLYNPAPANLLGFALSTLINYLAITGVGFISLTYAFHYKNIYRGIARLLIAIPVTYLFPNNFIVFLMNFSADYMFKHNITYYVRWLLTVCIGIISFVGVVYFEQFVTMYLSKHIVKIIKKLAMRY